MPPTPNQPTASPPPPKSSKTPLIIGGAVGAGFLAFCGLCFCVSVGVALVSPTPKPVAVAATPAPILATDTPAPLPTATAILLPPTDTPDPATATPILPTDTPEPTDTPAPTVFVTPTAGPIAEMMCQEFVKKKLKAPSTADFGGLFDDRSQAVFMTIEQAEAVVSAEFIKKLHNPDGVWGVTGSVDAQNSFGAMLRSDYTCVLDYDPADDKWYPLSVEVKDR